MANAIRSAFFVLPPPLPASCWLPEPIEICWRQQNNNNNNWEENSIVATFAASLVMRNLAEWKGGRGSRAGTEADEREGGDVWRGLPSFSHLAGHSNATWPINYATAWHMQPVPSAEQPATPTPIRTETRTIVTATYKRRAPLTPLALCHPRPPAPRDTQKHSSEAAHLGLCGAYVMWFKMPSLALALSLSPTLPLPHTLFCIVNVPFSAN